MKRSELGHQARTEETLTVKVWSLKVSLVFRSWDMSEIIIRSLESDAVYLLVQSVHDRGQDASIPLVASPSLRTVSIKNVSDQLSITGGIEAFRTLFCRGSRTSLLASNSDLI